MTQQSGLPVPPQHTNSSTTEQTQVQQVPVSQNAVGGAPGSTPDAASSAYNSASDSIFNTAPNSGTNPGTNSGSNPGPNSNLSPNPGSNPAPGDNPSGPKHPALIAGLTGVLGGILGASLVFGVLWGSGIVKLKGSSTSSTTAQTITINSDTDDVTTAQAVSAKVLPSIASITVQTESGTGLGSGVVYDTNGNIITNYHVIEGASAISVNIGGKSYTATVVGSDASSDLAVIKADLEGDEVTPATMGDSSALKVGSWVMTAGTPFGLDQSVSAGIVSALSRNDVLTSSSGTTIYTNLIQVDAAINPGNSGGALVNEKGEVVGITTLFSSDTQSFAGIGYAIPSNYAVKVAQSIISGNKMLHAYLGVNMVSVNAYNAQRNNLAVNQGAYVATVEAGSAAEAAGIQQGDIITKVGDTEISSATQVILAVRNHEIGDTVTITVMRGSEELTLEATLGDDANVQSTDMSSNSSTGTGYGTNGYGTGTGTGLGNGQGTGNGTGSETGSGTGFSLRDLLGGNSSN